MASAKRSVEIEPAERRLTTSSQSVFQSEEGLRLLRYPVQQLQVANSSPMTRQLTGFINTKMFPSDPDAIVRREPVERPIWRRDGSLEEEDDCDDDDDEDVEEGNLDDERLDVGEGCIKIDTDKLISDPYNPGQIDKREMKQHATLGVSPKANHQQGKDYRFQNVLPISAISGDGHSVRVVNASEPPATQGTELPVMENGFVTTMWKEAPFYESVRSILSDPFTGELMDNAVIFPCGHSFGAGGCKHCLQKKACYTCSLPVTEGSVQRNLTLRAAVAAFRREEYDNRSSKRRRDMFEEKADISDSNHMESPRSRKLKFPFAVTDRVMIVGNKRTPQRFVGREAIIMTQCLNGWYVVKTVDNGESVKLQYRSLTKVR